MLKSNLTSPKNLKRLFISIIKIVFLGIYFFLKSSTFLEIIIVKIYQGTMVFHTF
jgi:hypothetical protein